MKIPIVKPKNKLNPLPVIPLPKFKLVSDELVSSSCSPVLARRSERISELNLSQSSSPKDKEPEMNMKEPLNSPPYHDEILSYQGIPINNMSIHELRNHLRNLNIPRPTSREEMICLLSNQVIKSASSSSSPLSQCHLIADKVSSKLALVESPSLSQDPVLSTIQPDTVTIIK